MSAGFYSACAARFFGASLDVMERDTPRMRRDKSYVFANMKAGEGLDDVIAFICRKGGLAA